MPCCVNTDQEQLNAALQNHRVASPAVVTLSTKVRWAGPQPKVRTSPQFLPPASPPPHAPPLRHSPPRLRLLSRGGPVAGLAVVLGRAADLGRGAHSASVLVCPRPRLVFVRRRAGRQPAERAIAPGPAPLPSGLY